MNACGIICEYNPFHNGHLFLIQRIRRDFQAPVVCVMSGDFVQRAEFALYDKRLRADWAIRAGADLVLELPFPYCSMTAEIFARGAVEILEKSGLCGRLVFGSESGDMELLEKIAGKLTGAFFEKKVRSLQKARPQLSFAQARQRILEESFGGERVPPIKNPNDILGLEYIKALRRHGSDITPCCIKREGAPHDGKSAVGDIASATHIRTLLRNGDIAAVKRFVPEWVYADIEKTPHHEIIADQAVICALALSDPRELRAYAEIGGGLEYTIKRAAYQSDSLAMLYDAIKSKSLTDAKVRRAVLFAFLKVEKKYMTEMPLYTRVLAMSERGRGLLRRGKDQSGIILASRNADIGKDKEASVQFEKACRARIVFEKLKRPAGQ